MPLELGFDWAKRVVAEPAGRKRPSDGAGGMGENRHDSIQTGFGLKPALFPAWYGRDRGRFRTADRLDWSSVPTRSDPLTRVVASP